MHPGYVTFLRTVYKNHNCNRVVHIGDLVDWASISYHPKAPSLKNSSEEFKKARKQVKEIHKAFPKATWLIGNHDALTERHANDVGLPMEVFKDYVEMWNVPGWRVVPRYGHVRIDGVIYQHGDRGRGGKMAAVLNMEAEYCSLVQGHLHAQSGVWYRANQRTLTFGMQVGCGIDHKAAAMQYGMKFNQKPIVGCGVVYEGRSAAFIPMPL